ncbi:hypothetical protein AB0F81_36945 [Actinoplanes sp. NPDC024001]|uniref:alpha/beta fold hydrolase n=1 Tax=Actinoplanes sp. NPDC024001 TaxID=3154598 RepID=UPI0033FB56D7
MTRSIPAPPTWVSRSTPGGQRAGSHGGFRSRTRAGSADAPGRLFPLSRFAAAVARHCFGKPAPGYDLRPRLPRICAPTLVVVSRYCLVCPPAAFPIIAAGIPQAELREIAEAGHLPFSEESAILWEVVRGFLGRIGPGSDNTPR